MSFNSRGYIHQVDHGSAWFCTEAIGLQIFVWNIKNTYLKQCDTAAQGRIQEVGDVHSALTSNTVTEDVRLIWKLTPGDNSVQDSLQLTDWNLHVLEKSREQGQFNVFTLV